MYKSQIRQLSFR